MLQTDESSELPITNVSRPKLASRLGRGVSAWLEYEYQCHHGHLFSEKYLSVPIGNILSTYYSTKVYAEVTHPILESDKGIVAGKPPKLDFAVVNEKKEIQLAIETKWCGDTLPTASSVVWDLIRLELLAAAYGTQCFFLLAGQHKQTHKFFQSVAFNEKKGRAILSRRKEQYRLKLNEPKQDRVKNFKDAIRSSGNTLIPCSVMTQCVGPYPKNLEGMGFEVYIWYVQPSDKRDTFDPTKHYLYQS